MNESPVPPNRHISAYMIIGSPVEQRPDSKALRSNVTSNGLPQSCKNMGNRSAKEISEELNRLTLEQIESLKNEIFLRLTPEELRRQRERLQRIREVFADFLAAFKRDGS